EFIPAVIDGMTSGSWASVAGIAWTLYDHALTLGDEVNYVWTKPPGWGTLLFFLIRYFGLASQLSRFVQDVQSYTTVTAIAKIGHISPGLRPGPVNWVVLCQFALFYLVEIALQMRIYAIYMRSRRLALFNAALFTAEIGTMLYLWWLSGCRTETMNDAWGSYRSRPVTACAETSGFPWYWVPAAVFEIWLASLAVYKVIQRIPRETFKSDILSVVLKDSVLYFCMITVVLCIHLISSSIEPLYFQLGIHFVSAGLTVGGSRLILHLRRTYYRRLDVTLTLLQSVIVFRERTITSFWDVDS
ncbi:hypothetical protein EXIGLDRAFT_721739, partial [Exidia glandulosa HHB12029]